MNLQLNSEDLRPIVREVVAQTLQALACSGAMMDGQRLAFSEPEAAATLGVKPHVLRDARLRGEVQSTKVGGRIAYERAELLAYLQRGRGG